MKITNIFNKYLSMEVANFYYLEAFWSYIPQFKKSNRIFSPQESKGFRLFLVHITKAFKSALRTKRKLYSRNKEYTNIKFNNKNTILYPLNFSGDWSEGSSKFSIIKISLFSISKPAANKNLLADGIWRTYFRSFHFLIKRF